MSPDLILLLLVCTIAGIARWVWKAAGSEASKYNERGEL